MVQRNKRRSNKPKEITYKDLEKALEGRDINNLKQDDLAHLEKLGFGDWIKRNAGNIAQVAGGALLTATGIGAGAGIGLMSSGVTGAIGDAQQQSQIKAQNAATEEANALQARNMQEQQLLQSSMATNPGFVATARMGGRLRKFQTGGVMQDPVGEVQAAINTAANTTGTPSINPAETGIQQRNRVFKGQVTDDVALGHTSLAKGSITGLQKFDRDPLNKYYGKYGIERNEYIDGKYVNLPTEYVSFDDFTSYFDTHKDAFKASRYANYLEPKQMGGTINYSGQSHEGPDGGIPVDGMGNPSTNPTALTEGKETAYNAGEQGTYVFSDTLKYDKNKTFADMSKALQGKYKLRGKTKASNFNIVDPIAKKGYDADMQKLIGQQEQLKEMTMPQQPQQEMPKFDGTNKNNIFLPRNATVSNFNNIEDFSTFAGTDFGISGTKDYSTPSQQSFDIAGSNKFSTPIDAPIDSVATPYSGMTWGEAGIAALPGIASGVSNLLRPSMKNKFKRLSLPQMQAEQISLDAERASAREQANVARADTSRGIRSGAPTSGSYMANMIAGESGIQRGLGQQLGQSYQNEAVTNAQMRQQAAMANQQAKVQEQMYNTQLAGQEKGMDYARINQGISQIGQGVTGALSQKFQSGRDADYLNMQNPNYSYTMDFGKEDPNWWNRQFNYKKKLTPRG
jgi:hypothetical protein